EVTVAAAADALNKILEALGQLHCGKSTTDAPGTASMRMIIPAKVTSAVIGPGGQIVRQMRFRTQMHVHIESITIPPGSQTDSAEQVVSFQGPFPGIRTALLLMADILLPYVEEPWFRVWGTTSNSGIFISGLVLFHDGKGKAAKGGGKGKGAVHGSRDGSDSAGLCLKLLVPPGEASCVLGRGGSVVREISQNTTTRINTSARGEFYPGTQLQELRVFGATQQAVLQAVAQILAKIAELSGAISGGDHNAEPGSARLKVVVPFRSACAIIGPGGRTIKEVVERSGMLVHIEEATIPPGPPHELTEQVVSLTGSIDGLSVALSMIAEVLSRYAGEPWFQAWSSNSHCGLHMPGPFLFAKGKGKGKGIGK
ncbi:unnamed protein product, partial [Polarella glacialis]